MHNLVLRIALCSTGIFFMLSAHGQDLWWRPVQGDQSMEETRISEDRLLLVMDSAYLQNNLAGVGQKEISFPDLNGAAQRFIVWEQSLMEAPLQAKYPGIRTFSGYALTHPSTHLTLTFRPGAWHAMVRSAKESYFIDPLPGKQGTFWVVSKKSSSKSNLTCLSLPQDRGQVLPRHLNTDDQGRIEGGIREYRMAVSTTAGYTNFYGGTKAGALFGIVNTLSRVNMVFERDLAIRFKLVANNDTLIITDINDDPFTAAGLEGQRNQQFTDERIGVANYDLGHVFDSGEGGYAWPASACGAGIKAHAYTGLPSPEGDAFDIDYVAHEIAHQLGGNHSYNGIDESCGSSRNPLSAFEPGSGTTILAYAGICGSDNVASASDDYFHGGSIAEMYRFIQNDLDGVCGVVDTVDMQGPIIKMVGEGLLFIPILTPFELEASAEGSGPLSYNWEEVDLGGPARLGAYGSGDAPLFRSYPPQESAKRIFPKKEKLLRNQLDPAELLPNKSRKLEFQFTVRDHTLNSPAISWKRITYYSTERAGPFRIDNSPPLIAGTYFQLKWDPAHTNTEPVNCEQVDIYLSTNGGFEFSIPLASEVPNSGSAIVYLPDSINTTLARFKVKASDNIFFDLSDSNFPIRPSASTDQGINLLINDFEPYFCGQDQISLPVFVNAFGLAADDQPQYTLSSPILPGAIRFSDTLERQLFLDFKVDSVLKTGTYPVKIYARSSAYSDSLLLDLQIIQSDSLPATQLSWPDDEASTIALQPQFTWLSNPAIDAFQLEIAQDSSFETLVYTSPLITDTTFLYPERLNPETNYYWRLQSLNTNCGLRIPSPAQRFSTEMIVCKIFEAGDLPIPFNALPFIQSNVVVEEDLEILDVNLLNVKGVYENPGGLSMRLKSPKGPVLEVLARKEQCDSTEQFWFSLDDEAKEALSSCPGNEGQSFQPDQNLETFNGQSALGKWTLSVFDNGAAGSLDSWALEICFGSSALLTNLQEVFSVFSDLKVYPNPSLNELHFEWPYPEPYLLNIYDLQGRTILNTRQEGNSHLQINNQDWEAGFYFYTISSKKGQQTGKLVKL